MQNQVYKIQDQTQVGTDGPQAHGSKQNKKSLKDRNVEQKNFFNGLNWVAQHNYTLTPAPSVCDSHGNKSYSHSPQE